MIKINTKARGDGRAIITRGDGTVEIYDTKNTLLDNFFRAISGGTAPYIDQGVVKVGTGTLATNVTDNALGSPLAANVILTAWPRFSMGAPTLTRLGNDLMETKWTAEGVFPIGAIVGNITEWGVTYANSSTTITSGTVNCRILVTDAQGNPVALTLYAEDQLTLQHTVTLVQDEDVTLPFTLTGSTSGNSAHTMRYCVAVMPTGYKSISWSGTNSSQQNVTFWDGTPGIKPVNNFTQRDTTGAESVQNAKVTYDTTDALNCKAIVVAEVDQANFTLGIGGISLYGGYDWRRFDIEPPITTKNGGKLEIALVRTFERV